jgi:hypothetical protein
MSIVNFSQVPLTDEDYRIQANVLFRGWAACPFALDTMLVGDGRDAAEMLHQERMRMRAPPADRNWRD